jgi:hypothetical protein
MTAPARMGLKLLGSSVAALILIYIALYFFLPSSQFREWLQAELSARSGLDVRLTDLSLEPPLALAARALEISKPGEFIFKAARLSVSLTPLDLWWKTVHRVDVERPVLEIDIDQMMKPSTGSSAKFGLRHLNVQDGLVVLKKSGAKIFELPNIHLQARNLNLGQQSGISLRADVPWLQGEMELNLSGGLRALDAEVVLRSKRAQAIFRGSGSGNADPELLRLHAKFQAPENQPANATIEGKFMNLTAGERHFSGNLTARAAIDSSWTKADFTGHAVLANLTDIIGPVAAKLPRGDGSADFSGSFSLSRKTLTVKSIDVSSPLGNGAGQGVAAFAAQPRIANAKMLWRDIPLDALRAALPPPFSQWRIEGRGQIDLDLHGPFDALQVNGLARSEAAKVEGDNVSLASLSFALPFEWSSPAARIKDAKITATKLAVGGKQRWQGAAARVQINASSDFSAKDSVKIGGTIEAAGGNFTSPDSSKVGENLAIRGPFELTWLPGKNSASIHGNFTAESGEILWGKFFSDLKARKPALDIDGDYSRDQDRVDCRRCNVSLANVGAIAMTGSIEALTQTPILDLQARSSSFLPGGFFEFVLRENLNRQFPFLDKLAVGGQLAFQTQLRGTLENLAAEGELSLKGGELRSKSNNWEVGPIALDLPFQVTWGEAKKATSKPPRGTLTIEKMRFGSHDARINDAAISLFNNELRSHQPIRIAIFGGEIIVGGLLWPDVIAQPKQLSFWLETKRLELQELTQALDWPRFSGTLTASIPEVQSAGGALKTNGEIQAELFGGRMRMSKLEIENPFSSLAAIRLDANLANIELEQLSKTFAFGQISGILEGTIADLIITDGQPAQFGADLHTVDRGSEQRISVEALNTITVLSSGQNAGALYGGLAGLFDSFRYSKLGFKAILRNDRLTLRGVETRGNEEYLVVGSFLPPTVNIVSHTQTIGFSELLRRLERIKADKPEVK